MKKRKINLLIAAAAVCMLLTLPACSGQGRDKEYVSEVEAANCILCGEGNIYWGTEAMGFVNTSGNDWNYQIVGSEGVGDKSYASYSIFSHSENNTGISGNLITLQPSGLIVGKFDISRCEGADPDYLCSVLCQGCFDKVYPVTRDVEFFVVDCKTGEVCSLYGAGGSGFQIGNYKFEVQSWDSRMEFCAVYSETAS